MELVTALETWFLPSHPNLTAAPFVLLLPTSACTWNYPLLLPSHRDPPSYHLCIASSGLTLRQGYSVILQLVDRFFLQESHLHLSCFSWIQSSNQSPALSSCGQVSHEPFTSCFFSTLWTWNASQLSVFQIFPFPSGNLEPLAFHLSSMIALSLVPNTASCASKEQNAQLLLVPCSLSTCVFTATVLSNSETSYISFTSFFLSTCVPPTGFPNLPRASRLHNGHSEDGNDSSSATKSSHIFLLKLLRLHVVETPPVPCTSILLLTF